VKTAFAGAFFVGAAFTGAACAGAAFDGPVFTGAALAGAAFAFVPFDGPAFAGRDSAGTAFDGAATRRTGSAFAAAALFARSLPDPVLPAGDVTGAGAAGPAVVTVAGLEVASALAVARGPVSGAVAGPRPAAGRRAARRS